MIEDDYKNLLSERGSFSQPVLKILEEQLDTCFSSFVHETKRAVLYNQILIHSTFLSFEAFNLNLFNISELVFIVFLKKRIGNF